MKASVSMILIFGWRSRREVATPGRQARERLPGWRDKSWGSE